MSDNLSSSLRVSVITEALFLLWEPSLDRVCDPVVLFRFILCDPVGKYVPLGAWPDDQAPVLLGVHLLIQYGRIRWIS